MSVNKVILVGNVGKDPETRYLEGGTVVTRFPMATSEVYRNRDGEKITNTEWHNIVLWRGLAEVAEKYVKKGTQLYIEGRIRNRSYTDKEGNTRYTTDIIGDNMQMLGRRSDDGPDTQNDYNQEEKKESVKPTDNSNSQKKDDVYDQLKEGPDEADDLPF
ncbi:MAG: single-stranded DNA-binding protein [Bacteroidales bacterium]|jgi:single-strand DNA-binding protein